MPPITPTPMPDPISAEAFRKFVDHGSSMSDRWLFFFMLCLFIIVVWMVAKFFVTQLAARDRQIAELQKEIRELQNGFNLFLQTQVRDQSIIVEKNTETIRLNTESMGKKMALLETMHGLLKQLPFEVERRS